jgi:Flp pilus assembly pilin Flp
VQKEIIAMLNVIRQFVKEEDGLAAAEYAMLLALIAVFLITAITTFRNAIATAFGQATAALTGS